MESLREKFRVAPVTVLLAGACVVGYVLEVFFLTGERGADLSLWTLSGNSLADGRYWTLVTHLFLHANLLHLMVNVLGLWFIGPEVEYLLGRAKYLVLYFLSGIAGGLLQTFFSPPTSELIGASGSVCGLLLSFTTAYPEMPLRALLFFIIPVNMKAKMLGRGLIVVSLVCAVLRIVPQVGHLAHLGGALMGALLTWWWLPSAPRPVRPANRSERDARTEELLARVMEEGIDSLSREEKRQLEALTRQQPRRW